MSNLNPPTAFAGTASHYTAYRPPYPDEFLSDLRSRAKTTGHGLLLELACGPGRLAIPMAPYFDSVLAIDVEAEVIAVSETEAGRCGVANFLLARRAKRCSCPHELIVGTSERGN